MRNLRVLLPLTSILVAVIFFFTLSRSAAAQDKVITVAIFGQGTVQINASSGLSLTIAPGDGSQVELPITDVITVTAQPQGSNVFEKILINGVDQHLDAGIFFSPVEPISGISVYFRLPRATIVYEPIIGHGQVEVSTPVSTETLTNTDRVSFHIYTETLPITFTAIPDADWQLYDWVISLPGDRRVYTSTPQLRYTVQQINGLQARFVHPSQPSTVTIGITVFTGGSLVIARSDGNLQQFFGTTVANLLVDLRETFTADIQPQDPYWEIDYLLVNGQEVDQHPVILEASHTDSLTGHFRRIATQIQTELNGRSQLSIDDGQTTRIFTGTQKFPVPIGTTLTVTVIPGNGYLYKGTRISEVSDLSGLQVTLAPELTFEITTHSDTAIIRLSPDMVEPNRLFLPFVSQ